MHPELTALADHVRATFGNRTAEELNRKPGPKSWSAAECLDHLVVLDRLYFDLPERIRNGTYRANWLTRVGPYVRLGSRLMERFSDPEARTKVGTVSLMEPSHSTFGTDIVDRYLAHLADADRFIGEVEALGDRAPVIRSPASPLFVYPLAEVPRFLVRHHWRHIRQAERALG